jgi:hypothetical protein
MPRKSPFTIVLTASEMAALESMARSYTLPYFQVIRAKVVLLAARGWDNSVIAQRLDLPREVVSRWRKRFYERRMGGLEDLPRPGRPRVFSPSGRRGGQSRGL